MYKYNYPMPAITADIICYNKSTYSFLLIKRKHEPYCGWWALPGGFMEINEILVETAQRELKEETGLNLKPYRFKPLRIFDDVGRDPRSRTLSQPYFVMIRDEEMAGCKAGDDAAELMWVPSTRMKNIELAFDHRQIIDFAIFNEILV